MAGSIDARVDVQRGLSVPPGFGQSHKTMAVAIGIKLATNTLPCPVKPPCLSLLAFTALIILTGGPLPPMPTITLLCTKSPRGFDVELPSIGGFISTKWVLGT